MTCKEEKKTDFVHTWRNRLSCFFLNKFIGMFILPKHMLFLVYFPLKKARLWQDYENEGIKKVTPTEEGKIYLLSAA